VKEQIKFLEAVASSNRLYVYAREIIESVSYIFFFSKALAKCYMTDFINLSISSTSGGTTAVSISERVVATGPTFLSIAVSEVEGE